MNWEIPLKLNCGKSLGLRTNQRDTNILWSTSSQGERVIGYDNSEQKGDHRHYRGQEKPYTFTTLRQLADDFLADVEEYKRNSS